MAQVLAKSAGGLAASIVAAVIYVAASWQTHTPLPTMDLIERFRFHAAEIGGSGSRTVRPVHPKLRHIDGWVSSMGAAIALGDLAGIGQPSDLCLVDPRDDSVSILPAPGTERQAGAVVRPYPYEAFRLPLHSAGYQPHTIASMGCLPADLNEDGKLDLLVYYWGRTPVVYLQTGEGTLNPSRFRAVDIIAPGPSGEGQRWNTSAAILADVDGDGHPDLVFGNYFRDGDRVFDPNATDEIELQHSWSRAANGGNMHLLLWKGAKPDAVLFEDYSHVFDQVAPKRPMAGSVARGWTLALAAADLTGDQLPEVYVANDFGSDRLLFNKSTRGNPAFSLVEGKRSLMSPRSHVLGRDSFKGMGVDFGDPFGKGRLAIAVSNISETYALLESHFLFLHTGHDQAWAHGYAPYENASWRLGTWTGGWGWDVKFADLDNDGRSEIVQAIGYIKGKTNRWPELQELAIGSDELLKYQTVWPRFSSGDDISGSEKNDRLFSLNTDGYYQDIWLSLGLDQNSVSRGVAVGDVFGDGRLSIAIARQWMPSLFLRNLSPMKNHWLVLDLRVPGLLSGSRAAIGATAEISLPNGQHLVGYVDGGSGHGGRRPAEIHLGLGASVPMEVPVKLTWRDEKGSVRTAMVTLQRDRRHRMLLNTIHINR